MVLVPRGVLCAKLLGIYVAKCCHLLLVLNRKGVEELFPVSSYTPYCKRIPLTYHLHAVLMRLKCLCEGHEQLYLFLDSLTSNFKKH